MAAKARRAFAISAWTATMPPPQFHIYTGDGKGKTSCAIGLAIRAVGAGMRVDFIAFDKGFADEEHYSERPILRALPSLWFEPSGLERMRPGQKFRFGATPEDRAEARRALDVAAQRLATGPADILVLDEILSAIAYRLLKEDDVWPLIETFLAQRPRELVMTGRAAPNRFIEAADLVTEMRPVKHYFESGVEARRGIDF